VDKNNIIGAANNIKGTKDMMIGKVTIQMERSAITYNK